MKITTLSFLSLALFLGSSIAADGKKEKFKPAKAPIKNHWDSNAWEKGSSTSFWRASTPSEGKKAQPTKQPEKISPKPKQSTS